MTVHTYVNVSVLRLVCAGPSARHAFTANDRGHVRIITLRLFPAAAAEWAKPREIRRPLLASAAGAAPAWTGNSVTLFLLLYIHFLYIITPL